jgi:hypothetical protein
MKPHNNNSLTECRQRRPEAGSTLYQACTNMALFAAIFEAPIFESLPSSFLEMLSAIEYWRLRLRLVEQCKAEDAVSPPGSGSRPRRDVGSGIWKYRGGTNLFEWPLREDHPNHRIEPSRLSGDDAFVSALQKWIANISVSWAMRSWRASVQAGCVESHAA